MDNVKEEDIGKAFQWTPTGAVFLCIAWDLETWSGVCIKGTGNKRLPMGERCKVGELHQLNADSPNFEALPGKIEF